MIVKASRLKLIIFLIFSMRRHIIFFLNHWYNVVIIESSPVILQNSKQLRCSVSQCIQSWSIICLRLSLFLYVIYIYYIIMVYIFSIFSVLSEVVRISICKQKGKTMFAFRIFKTTVFLLRFVKLLYFWINIKPETQIVEIRIRINWSYNPSKPLI